MIKNDDKKSNSGGGSDGTPLRKSATNHPHRLARQGSTPKLQSLTQKLWESSENDDDESSPRQVGQHQISHESVPISIQDQNSQKRILDLEEQLKMLPNQEKEKAILWAVLASNLPDDKSSLQKEFVKHVEYTLAQTRNEATNFSGFQALSMCTRDRLIERWKDTSLFFQQNQVKKVNYLSLEFLLGRSLQNGLVALGLDGKYADSLMELGYKIEDLYDEERDAGLGNGGLGRLAACFMDSLATCNLPGYGYGLRYKFGMFYQAIIEGEQVELPDYWLNYGSPWEIERLDVTYHIGFCGKVTMENGRHKWEPSEQMLAVAYDYPIPGFKTYNTVSIRLWSSKPSDEFNLESFNKGDYLGSIEEKQKSENITAVLYPNDNTMAGKELRLKQQYLFVSATIQDIISQFLQTGKDLKEFSNSNAIQLNDTHPTLGIPELMRILMDVHFLTWDDAWSITTKTFAYTNHTVLPEALERWSVDLLTRLLPRHIQIIYEINERFLRQVEKLWPGDMEKRRQLSIIDESHGRTIKMAFLAIIGSQAVNGVAELHSELVKHSVFPDFYSMWPEKFQNKTNGVTPRRWIHQANPHLSQLFTQKLNSSRWLTQLDMISDLQRFVDDTGFQKEWMQIKKINKIRLAKYIEEHCQIKVSADILFDCQVKRFHEYKRQLLNILGVIHRYLEMKSKPQERKYPRVVIFAGKAAPGYYMAKLIIKLINSVANVINNDHEVNNYLKIVFIPNYAVSNAEIIIPASDLSQHISTAGTEASGTSNMKFSMNGGLIIGTLDGANIEIREEICKENMYIFGAQTPEVESIKKKIREGTFTPDKRWVQVLTAIKEGKFGNVKEFQPIIDSISHGNDHYILSYDFPSYLDIQQQIDKDYYHQDKSIWSKKSIMASIRCGKFSSDRTIREYAKQIWDIKELQRPGPVHVPQDITQGLIKSKSPVGSPHDSFISMERLSPYPGVSPSNHTSNTSSKDESNLLKPKQVIKGFNPSN
ncbi:glycogen phosphorylase 2 [Tieghemostelium lacteum]|uniref:Alpha-1,4 glucan phosphorylase n=1 Tax=Tieghemostelium lacteum TaxID=361077 RepID=A0A151Z402_TIELA|nr:glycogen phosphorylase 2 [Tieghemostelium lacteum]|eukprot:KYQ88671.1 glycogen phosphorylase 2 [Tieghemostelium lacteum]